MKKILLLMMCCPMILSAQNSVTVSGLDVKPGTVTFNVSWNDDMPLNFLWSDTVWVFVDYNNAGKMERLLLSSATLTAPSWSAATVIVGEDSNYQGAWVIGNARSAGSFSATVQLHTAIADLAGVCAYASNYPPVGEYKTPKQLVFTGTPPYNLVLVSVGSGTRTYSINDNYYNLYEGETLQSFSDKTGAPGTMKCIVPATYTLNVSASSFCAGSEGVQFTLSGTENGRLYQLFRGTEPVGTLSGTGSAGTFNGAVFDVEGMYTAAAIADDKYCAIAMSGAHTIAAYPAFTVGEIITASTTTQGAFPNITIQSVKNTSGGSGNIAYLWLRTGTSASTLTSNGAATYAINSVDYSGSPGTHYFNRYAKDAACNMAWVAAEGTYTLMVELMGVNQKQGGCTFTQSTALTTFASFNPSSVGASTFVTLTDERDGNNYTVVKIGSRWIMAQNLNYKGTSIGSNTFTLTFNSASNQANGMEFTSITNGVPAIGSFWCPGSGSTSTITNCDYWGALYTWETAMMLDGRGTWTEGNLSYCGNTCNSAECKVNWGRNANSGTVTGGRGICPENWHVPTDYEWGVIFDNMESATPTTVHSNNTSYGWYGTNAGTRGKSKCGGTVSDTLVNWSSGQGTDNYGFRALPTGLRAYNGSSFHSQGRNAWFWSSSANNSSYAWERDFFPDNTTVARYADDPRSTGGSVRCIKNQ
jgi:uncharacterized protein (TIGR02145 family)